MRQSIRKFDAVIKTYVLMHESYLELLQLRGLEL